MGISELYLMKAKKQSPRPLNTSSSSNVLIDIAPWDTMVARHSIKELIKAKLRCVPQKGNLLSRNVLNLSSL